VQRAVGSGSANGSSRRTGFRLRQMGDRCRDQRQWQQAKIYYEQYLEIVPEDAAIWVQYGHACKELGDRAAAETAYRKGTEVSPQDLDARFWLGQMIETKRDISDALPRVQASDGAESEAARRGAADTLPKRVLIDLSDVIIYLHNNTTVSGIQRVQLGLADALLRMMPLCLYKLAFVCGRDDGSRWLEIDNPHLETLVKKMAAPVVDHEEIKETLFQIEGDAAPYEPTEGDLFLILGAFWDVKCLIDLVIALQRAGAVTGILIHDLIPITHPEFVVKTHIGGFHLDCDSLFRMVDFILTVSDHTGRMLCGYLREREIPAPPITTLRLAHRTGPEPPKDGQLRSPLGARLLRRPYVLYVSTIDVRKNHIYLFQVWKRLQEELGSEIPTLIFVGQRGWGVNDLMEQLESADYLYGKIQIVSGLSDPELAELYRNCLFTVFPSFVEGWGLPVGESLVFGRPCLAANTSSLPEVAGALVDYLDPFNVNDGYKKIKKFIVDAEFRENRAVAIRTSFRPRLWSDVANDLLRIVEERAGEPRSPHRIVEPPVLCPGVIYRIGHGGDHLEYVRSGRASLVQGICGVNWYDIEDWGRWMRGHSASLNFRLAEDQPREIMLMIELKTVEGFQGSVLLGIGEVLDKNLDLKAGSIERLTIKAKPKDRTVRIDFESMDQIMVGDDPKLLSVGICSIAYAPIDDLPARLNLLETLSAQVCDFRPSDTPADLAYLEQKLALLLKLVDEQNRPNLNVLWELVKDIELIKLNLKFFGYELARQLAAALPVSANLAPRRIGLRSKPSTQADLESDWVAYWCSELKIPRVFHRKLWEYAYVLQALYEHDMLGPGFQGLGFGCGLEPLPSYLASRGVEITATDLPADDPEREIWARTDEHAESLDRLFQGHLVSRSEFDRNVNFQPLDMRSIPTDLTGYDFCWSICAFEHLGSISSGLDFVESSLNTLRPGGLAVHTTEYNFLNEDQTNDNWNPVLYQRKHFEALMLRLEEQGHHVADLDFDYGNKPLDKFIDLPPWIHDWPESYRKIWGDGHNHLKVAINGFASTCFGLIIRKSD
jgi:glycosyltransferase involved in cell wall biosynthesis